MRHVALLHSVYGLRPAVLAAADRLRAAGHRVVAPDLYGVPAAETVEDGFALLDRIGWATVLDRARAGIRELPPDAVLLGLSMGAGVAGAMLPERPSAAGLVLLHAPSGTSAGVRPGLPVQVQVADPDEYAPPDEFDAWRREMTAAGADLTVHRYPGVGHLYTDPDLPDHDETAAERTWERVLAFLDGR